MSKSLAMSRVLSPLAKQLRADRCFAILSAAHLSDKYL